MKFYWTLLFLAAPSLAASPAILGTWQSNCYAYPTRHSFVAKLSVTSSSLNSVIDQYEDSFCVTPALTISISGPYYIETEGLALSGIDISPSSVLITLTDTDPVHGTVPIYNARKACGFSNWVLDAPKDITGVACPEVAIPNLSLPINDIFGVTNDVLRFGSFPLPNSGKMAISLSQSIQFNRTQ